MADPVFAIVRVDQDGGNAATLDSSVFPETITRTLNEQDQATLSFPKTKCDTGDLGVLVIDTDDGPKHREIQIVDTANVTPDGASLLFWGPITSMTGSADDGAVHASAQGVDWYLFRRFLDGDVTQYLSNPQFDDSEGGTLGDWVDQDGTALPTDNVVLDSDRFFLGSFSAKLTGFGGVEFVSDDFITQSVSITAGTLGLAVVLSGWFWIGGATYSPAIDGRGLYLETRDGGGTFIANNYYVLDAATPRGKWIKASTSISIPPSTTYTVNARLYAGADGTTWWDDIKLVQFDSFGFVDLTADEDTAVDVGSLVCHLVDVIQDDTWGKSSLNISTDPTTVGKKVMKTYQFSEHVQFDQALQEYLERDAADGGIDYVINYDKGAGTRTFTNFAGKRGTDYTSDSVFIYQQGNPDNQNNLSSYRITKDGANCITRQTVLGQDSGPDREEAEVADASEVDGVTLQDVRQSPQDTEVVSLLGQANARIGLFKRPPIALEIDIAPPNAYITFLNAQPNCGDLVHVTIDDGYFSLDADLRIHQVKFNCKTLVTTLSLTVDGLS